MLVRSPKCFMFQQNKPFVNVAHAHSVPQLYSCTVYMQCFEKPWRPDSFYPLWAVAAASAALLLRTFSLFILFEYNLTLFVEMTYFTDTGNTQPNSFVRTHRWRTVYRTISLKAFQHHFDKLMCILIDDSINGTAHIELSELWLILNIINIELLTFINSGVATMTSNACDIVMCWNVLVFE